MRPYADTNFFTRLYLPLEESPHAVAGNARSVLGVMKDVVLHDHRTGE